MAKRYGGKFSPDPDSSEVEAPQTRPVEASFRGRAPARHAARINILFLLPLLILPTVFFRPVSEMITDFAGGAVLLLAAWLLRDGVRAEDAYNERKVARRPAIPRKIFASVLTGAGVGLLVFGGQWTVLNAGLVGVLAGALHLFSFGLDPLKDKGMDGVNRFQTERIAKKVEAAEAMLEAMHDAIGRTGDRQLVSRVEAFQATARDMFRTVEDDPRDLTQARKYLTVYLQGARDATIKYVDLHGTARDYSARSDYLSLLNDLETNFAARTQKMLLSDRGDLDVEIEVLRDRLNRETLHIDTQGQ
ncbi:MAG: hypothetical protein COW55_09690 [Rhodobacteraceae bacterium CG17_big_fil_post_rev_8_21_14_2_50_65_11]|nr:MAG: hypothetical protein COW55_09690 [Rhodobacteraceae bacterium CG17_big_fil_post_rev_8_21_14_2_50_65_11]